MRSFVGYEKGINFGGWFSQCEHTKKHYDEFIGESDFAAVSSWGIDHVRIPIDYNLIENGNGDIQESGMMYIQKCIDWCKKYRLNMILDLHKTYGFSFDEGESESGFFESEELQERFFRLWEEIAKRFGKYHDCVAFELLNEVTNKEYCDIWNEIADKCIFRIRTIAPETYILIGGYDNNCIKALKDLKQPYDNKIVYNFHCYEPFIFTHQGANWVNNMPENFRTEYPASVQEYITKQSKMNLNVVDLISDAKVETVGEEFFESLFSEAVEIAEERNVPLYCGEYGVINLADQESTIEWYKAINSAFKKYKISRAAWCYKKMDFGLIDNNIAEKIKKYL